MSFHSPVYACHSVSFILWKTIWHGIQRHGVSRFWFIHEAQAKDLKEFNKLWSVFVFSPQSVPKNIKSDLEISPDNEVLNSLSKETPQTPTACQGETTQSLSNLDKVWRKMPLSKCSFPSASINMNSFKEHAISLHLSCIKTSLSLLLV